MNNSALKNAKKNVSSKETHQENVVEKMSINALKAQIALQYAETITMNQNLVNAQVLFKSGFYLPKMSEHQFWGSLSIKMVLTY